MRAHHIRALVFTVLAFGPTGLAASFSSQDAGKDASKEAPKTVTLTGCVARGGSGNQFTLEDAKNGKYQVTGSDIAKYVGKRVEIVGTPRSSRFTIAGGLTPTPNVAAQAGAMDPARAAVAAMPGGAGSGTGSEPLPQLRVRSVHTLNGACE